MQAVEPIYLLIVFLMGLSSWLGLGINVTIGPPETSVTFGPPSQGVSFCQGLLCTCLNSAQSPTSAQEIIPVNAGQRAGVRLQDD